MYQHYQCKISGAQVRQVTIDRGQMGTSVLCKTRNTKCVATLASCRHIVPKRSRAISQPHAWIIVLSYVHAVIAVLCGTLAPIILSTEDACIKVWGNTRVRMLSRNSLLGHADLKTWYASTHVVVAPCWLAICPQSPIMWSTLSSRRWIQKQQTQYKSWH